jgi:ribosome-associated translation inhibitor RaiA
MRIDLAGNFPLSDDGRQRVEQRAEQKLSRFGNTVREATVTIDDVNGPKGGTDVRCLVRARLQHLPDVVIEEKADSIGRALHALDRAVHAISRAIAKRQTARRKAPDIASIIDDTAVA